MKRSQQGLERPCQQRLRRLGSLVRLKRRQAFCLKHPLGFIRKQHGIAVECNAHFVGMCFGGMRRVWINLRSGHTRIEGRTDIRQMRRQKQVGVERL